MIQAGKSTECFAGGPGFDSQSYGSSELPETPVGESKDLLWLLCRPPWHSMQLMHRQTCKQNTHTHKIKIRGKIFGK